MVNFQYKQRVKQSNQLKNNWSLVIGHWSLGKGFSIVEMLITATIFLILTGIGVGFYVQYYKNSLISSEVDQVVTLIKSARLQSLKNPAGVNYGVHIEPASNTFTLFKEAYQPGAMENKEIQLQHIEIQELNLLPTPGITNEVIFENQTGKTDNAGEIILENPSFIYTIVINTQGLVD